MAMAMRSVQVRAASYGAALSCRSQGCGHGRTDHHIWCGQHGIAFLGYNPQGCSRRVYKCRRIVCKVGVEDNLSR